MAIPARAASSAATRSVRLSENLYYELNKYGVRFYFADMPYYDPESYSDVMLRQIKEVIAEGYVWPDSDFEGTEWE